MMDMELTDPYEGISEIETEYILQYAESLATDLE